MKLYEALNLREDFNRKIRMLQKVLNSNADSGSFGRIHNSDQFDFRESVNISELKDELSKMKEKRYKLNEEIQKANLENSIEFRGEKVSLSRALEMRKNIKEEIDSSYPDVYDASRVEVIHKEDRTIKEPLSQASFNNEKQDLEQKISSFRTLMNKIHRKNHEVEVDFDLE